MPGLGVAHNKKEHSFLHYFLNSIVLVSQCSHMCREAVEKVLIDPKGSESDLGDSLSPLRLLHNISFRDIVCFSQLKQMKNTTLICARLTKTIVRKENSTGWLVSRKPSGLT